MKKENKVLKLKEHCPRCGCLDIKKLSTGEIICKNKRCMAISKIDWKKNEINMTFKLK